MWVSAVIKSSAMTRPLITLLVVCAGLASGCGGGSASTSGPPNGEVPASKAANPPDAHTGEEGGIAEFRLPGGKKREVNRIISGSKESSSAEREAATKVLIQSLEARGTRDWAGQCHTLSANMAHVVEANGVVIAPKQTCAENLATAGNKVPQAELADKMEGAIAALRLIGDGQAFAFYHGIEGKNYLIPMELEHGAWRVAAIAAQQLPDH
jgi:hypothetical protein